MNTTHNTRPNYRQRADALTTDGDVYATIDAIDALYHDNNRHGRHRCKGQLTMLPTGPAFTYCDRWQCWRCGPVLLGHERRRMVAGAELLAETGAPLWFVTLDAADAHAPLTVSAWSDRLGTLQAAWRKKLRRDGQNLTYCAVTALKPTTGQPHTHLLANALIAPVAAPTRHHADRYADAWLADCADRLGMATHIEHAAEPVAVARYMIGNLETMLDRDDLPALFRRVTYSAAWPAQSTRRPAARRRVGLTSTRTHTIAATAHHQHAAPAPTTTPPAPTRATVTTTATREAHNMAHDHHDGDGTGPRTCARCKREFPATDKYWQRDGDGWKSRCKDCTHLLDNLRDTRRNRRLDRRLQRTKDNANRRAAARGVVGVLTTADVLHALETANGVCHHCEKPIHGTWQLDHLTPFAHGGTNTRDNLCVSCPTCNLSKGTLKPVAWYYRLADRTGKRHQDAPDGLEIALPVPLPLRFDGGTPARRAA